MYMLTDVPKCIGDAPTAAASESGTKVPITKPHKPDTHATPANTKTHTLPNLEPPAPNPILRSPDPELQTPNPKKLNLRPQNWKPKPQNGRLKPQDSNPEPQSWNPEPQPKGYRKLKQLRSENPIAENKWSGLLILKHLCSTKPLTLLFKF